MHRHGATLLPERGGVDATRAGRCIDATRAGRCIAMGQHCYQSGAVPERGGAYRSGRCLGNDATRAGRCIDATRAGRCYYNICSVRSVLPRLTDCNAITTPFRLRSVLLRLAPSCSTRSVLTYITRRNGRSNKAKKSKTERTERCMYSTATRAGRGGVGAVHRCYQSGAVRCRSGAVHRHGATLLPERGGASPRGGAVSERCRQSGATLLPERGNDATRRGDGVGAGHRHGATVLPERGGVGCWPIAERGGASPWGIDAIRAGRCRGGAVSGQRCYQSGAVLGRCIAMGRRCRGGVWAVRCIDATRAGRCRGDGATLLPERGGAWARGIDATRAGRCYTYIGTSGTSCPV